MEPQSITDSGPDLWAGFVGSQSEAEYLQSWLTLQSRYIPGTIHAVLITGRPGSPSYSPVARWPEGEEGVERLADIAERSLAERCGLLSELEPGGDGSPARYALAYPVLVDDQLYGVVALEVSVDSQAELKPAMQTLQWGAGSLEAYYRRLSMNESKAAFEGLKASVDLLAEVLSEEGFHASAMTFVTKLSTRFGCDRVSLGLVRERHVKVQAVSHSAQFGNKMNLVRAIGLAMDEAVLQRKDISYPAPENEQLIVTRDHEELARRFDMSSILTMPIYGGGRYYGALTLERGRGERFTDEDVRACRSIVSLVAPVLESKRKEDRPLALKALDSAKTQLERLIGRGYLGRKLAGVALVAVVLFMSFAKGDYRVTADSTLEGAVTRSVVAPFNGYITDTGPRAGDTVKGGTLLCTLDDRDLRLERLNWLSQRNQYSLQQQDAFAKHDRARVNILGAQYDQATAELKLVESKLERTRITAPFDGLLVSGDLSQRLGGLVEQGEVLFEIAPLDEYRVLLQVDESDIRDVKVGQRGTLTMASLPEDEFGFVVSKITPITTAEEGRNYFRVEANLDGASESLRPGMEGVGKINVDRRRLAYIWTHDLFDWLRLWVWSWWP